MQLPIVNSGSPAPVVKAVQALLNVHGDGLVEDGKYGPRTTACVNAVRQGYHMPPGPVDASVWRILLGLAR